MRWHHLVLAAWTALWIPAAELHEAISWHYFRTGEQLLFNGTPGGGLALYAHHPELQIGPVSFLTAALFAPFRFHTGEELADAFMFVLGLCILVLIGRVAADHYRATGIDTRHLHRCLLIAGAAFAPMWLEVAVRFGHLDDVLALFFTTLAVHALFRGHAIAVALFLALAIDSKPWAVGFLPLLLAMPRSARLRPAALLAALVAAAWLPFYLSNPTSTAAARFTIRNHPASALRWLGVHTAGTPWWDRPAQMALGILLGLVALRRGRRPAIVLLAVDARILLDPGVHAYYDASDYVQCVCTLQAADPAFVEVLTIALPSSAVESRRAAAGRGVLELISRAKKAGHLRQDFSDRDLTILLIANSGVMSAIGTTSSDALRRLTAQMLRAFATPNAPLTPIPDAPPRAELYHAMINLLRSQAPCQLPVGSGPTRRTRQGR
ncbi:hypothetical protein C1N81_44030 [Streptomyces sp. SGAir0957]